MKKYAGFLFTLSIIIACNNNSTDETTVEKKLVTDTIALNRDSINKNPVASFHEKVNDSLLNDWAFDVKVFETKNTFSYLMKLQYEELTATDTLKIPNIGTEPIIEIHPDNNKYACIVGFLDKRKQFKPYKKISIHNNQLKVTVLNHYGVYISVK